MKFLLDVPVGREIAEWLQEQGYSVQYQSRSQSSQKRVCPITPSLRFPLQAGGTEPTRPTRFPSRSGGNLKEGGICKLCPCDWYNTNRRTRVHKKRQLTTPSCRFPLQAGGTEPTRPTRFPSRSGGNLKEGGNCKLCPCNWYDFLNRKRPSQLCRIRVQKLSCSEPFQTDESVGCER